MRDMSHKYFCRGESFQYHVLNEKPFRILLATKYAIEKVTLVQKLPSQGRTNVFKNANFV